MMLRATLTLLFTFVAAATFAFGQQKCDHTSNEKSRFDAMRILPPARIKNLDPHNVEIVYQDSHGIYTDTLNLDADSVIDEDVSREWKNIDVWIVLCSIDKHIYVISRVMPKQIAKH